MSRKKPAKKLQPKPPAAVAPRKSRWMELLVVAVPLLLYANTIGNKYAQDDEIVIIGNEFTQEGLAGIDSIFSTDAFDGARFLSRGILGAGRYRPLSIATFALEWELFGIGVGDRVKTPEGTDARIAAINYRIQPAEVSLEVNGQVQTAKWSDIILGNTSLTYISHAVNVLLFALVVLLLFLWLKELLRLQSVAVREYVPFIAAILFAAHPAHTEVVANIKGRDEILALLFGALAMLSALKYARNSKPSQLFLGAAAFLLALFAKESAYPLVAVTPLMALVFFNGKERKRLWGASAVLLATALAGVAIRQSVVPFSGDPSQDLMNNPYLEASGGQKFATIFYVLLRYLQLLVFPHPLTSDYYPYHIQLQTPGDPLALLALLLNLGLGALGLWLAFRKKHVLGFAILFHFITISIVSNIFVSVGTFMNERLMFIPSVGFCLALAWIIVWLGRKATAGSGRLAFADFMKKNPAGTALMIVLVAGYSFRTITRNPVWKDSLTLFTTDVEVSSGSAKANNAAGGALFEQAMEVKGQLVQASESPQRGGPPTSVMDRQALEVEWRELLTRSKHYLLKAVEIHPKYTPAWLTLGNDYYYLDSDIDSAIICYRNAGDVYSMRNLEIIAADLLEHGKLEGAIAAYRELNRRSPNDAKYLAAIGQAYGQLGDLVTAIEYLGRALEKAPNDEESLMQMGTAHAIMAQNIINAGGDLSVAGSELVTAIDYYHRAEKLDPNNALLMRNLAVAYQQIGRTAEYERYAQRARELGSM